MSWQQADYLWFVALVCAAFGAVQWWLVASRGLRLPRPALLLSLVLIAAGWFAVERASDAEGQRVRTMLLGFAPTYAGELSRMGHAQLLEPTPADDARLLRMIDAQKRWMRVNPAIVSIYTLRQRADGAIVFIVGAEVDYDGNGVYHGPREHRSVVGEVYQEAGEFWSRGFRGETAFDESPYTDQWGTWVSAVTPMYDAAGRIEAVLAVDYDARSFLRAVSVARGIVIAVIGTALLSILSISVIALLQTEYLRQLGAETTLRREKEVALAANKAKSEFLSNMSHELRTPLHAIVAFSRLGQEKADAGGKLAHYFTRIQESSARLLRLLDDLLDLSKLEAGKMTYRWERIDLEQIVYDAAEEFAAFARERNVQLRLQCHGKALVTGDARSLMQVLGNLFSNAIKYTATGTWVTVTLAAVEASRDCGMGPGQGVLLTVQDEGVGIPPDELEDVFDKFVQSSKTRTGAGGTGLGLSIARAIVGDHGGRIWASNNAERGASFHVLLPALARAEAETAPEPAALA